MNGYFIIFDLVFSTPSVHSAHT